MSKGLNQAVCASTRDIGKALQPRPEQQSDLDDPVHVVAIDLHHRFAELVAVVAHQAPDLEGIAWQGLDVFTCELDPYWTTVTEFPGKYATPIQLRDHPQHRYGVVELIL